MLRRTVFPTPSEPLPLQMETIGINPEQEFIQRPEGYPFFHWLQTIEGEGELTVQGSTLKLTERCGVLLHPQVSHFYQAKSPIWKTAYVTFTGTMASAFAISLYGVAAEKVTWDRNDEEITQQLDRILHLAESGTDASGWKSSAELYRFLALLKTNGRKNHLPSLTRRLERIQHLLDWLEIEYANPELGLAIMAEQLHIGARQLNDRFKKLFGQTAYAYLILIRLRKAKEWLPSRPDWTIRQIGVAVGFRDASHFIATFRQKEGMTPEKYRRLHGSS
jgi:AraC-like DNA-binding protein